MTKNQTPAESEQAEIQAELVAEAAKPRGGRKIILESGEARADAIRRLYAEGKTRKQIADQFAIRYQQVFQLTRGEDQQVNRPHCTSCTCYEAATEVIEPAEGETAEAVEVEQAS